MSGVEDAVIRNIEAVNELTQIVQTSFGPNGALSKMLLTRVLRSMLNSAADVWMYWMDGWMVLSWLLI